MRKRFEIDWVFFDIGGVLLDNAFFEKWRNETLVSILQKHEPSISLEKVLAILPQASGMIGNLESNILDLLLDDETARIKAQEEMRERWQNEVSYLEQSPIRTDAVGVVKSLSENYRLGIIANQPSEVKATLNAGGLLQYFSHTGISKDYNLHKPDARLFEMVLKETGADPRRSVMIDDNIERGLDPARSLGMKTVWFKLTEREPSSVDWIIYSLSDLLNIF